MVKKLIKIAGVLLAIAATIIAFKFIFVLGTGLFAAFAVFNIVNIVCSFIAISFVFQFWIVALYIIYMIILFAGL